MNKMNEKVEQFAAVKNQIVSALQLLPDTLQLLLAENSLETVSIREEVDADIYNLNEFWQFVSENHDKYVIALVGMVNAGKSALGNTLVQKSESEIFQEAAIRETQQPTIYNWGTETILVDLPGLGSVLSVEDDCVVQTFINRSNLLLITISVDSPIEKHLYNFLCSDVLKRGEEQQIIIVLNKFDVWDVIPDLHKQKKLERYMDFLCKGDSNLGFQGINALFDYEIPIVPFSVKHVRNEVDNNSLQNLYSTIASALSKSSDGWLIRSQKELESYFNKYSVLFNYYVQAAEELEESQKFGESLQTIIINILTERLTAFYEDVAVLDGACWEIMNSQSPPTWFEKTFETDGYSQKKAKLNQVRSDFEGKLYDSFSRFCRASKKSVESQIETAFGFSEEIQLSDSSGVRSALRNIVFGNWEMCHDSHFQDKLVTQEIVNSRTFAATEYRNKEIETWLEKTEWFKPLQIELEKKNQVQIETINSLDDFVRSLLQAKEMFDQINL